MLQLNVNIQISNYAFDYVSKLNIQQNLQSLTTTATIELPRNLKYKDTPVQDLIKQGDKVSIKTGYNGRLNTAFTGFVTRVGAGIPVKIECEDAMYTLKNTIIEPLSFAAGTSLKKVSQAVLPQSVQYEAGNYTLGKIKLDKTTVFSVLKMLFKQYQIRAYFAGNTLYIGNERQANTHLFEHGQNIISSKLEYKVKDDIHLKVKAVSIDSENKQEVVEVGDTDGDLRTFHFMNVSKSELKKLANEYLNKLKYEGYYGDFETFGQPFTQRGDTVQITDGKYPEREGNYFVEQVNRSFGVNGYRQTIFLGKKVA